MRTRTVRFDLPLASLIALLLLVAAQPIRAAMFEVNTTSDDVDANLTDNKCETAAGGGDCSLRAAVQQANATAGTDDIMIPAGVYSLITPGSDEDDGVTGDLDITQSVNIQGAGADQTFINGGRLDRVFDIDPKRAGGVVVTMTGLTVEDGSAGLGGGIANSGTLTLTRVALTGSSSSADGGGIFSHGPLTMMESLVKGNQSGSDGAGILCEDTLTLLNSTITGNNAGGSAGGIDSRGSLMLRFTTISSNTAGSSGGGLFNRAPVVRTSVGSTILANNVPSNCTTAVTTAGNNVESTNSCGLVRATDQHNADPMLCPLGNYGGPIQSQALPADSIARDKGASSGCPATDQRGQPRPRDGDGQPGAVCDVGAFEAQEPGGGCEEATPTPTPGEPTATPTSSPTPTPTQTPSRGAACVGDCDGLGTVSVNELVLGVNIALNRANASECLALDRNGSGTVAVDELVAAVNSALHGCPS